MTYKTIILFCFILLFSQGFVIGGGLPDAVIPDCFGITVHFVDAPEEMDSLAKAGFKYIRRDLNWEAYERAPGQYFFKEVGADRLTQLCTEHDVGMMYILDYSHRMYERDWSVRTERGRQAFASFAGAAARRFSGLGILWEIWNEPNTGRFWQPQPSAEDYCRLVAVAAPRIKAADKSGLVVGPATSGMDFEWLEETFKLGLLENIDVLSVHPYWWGPPEPVVGSYDKLRMLIKRYAPIGKEIPIISGEWGYSLIKMDKSRMTELNQAQYLVRMYLVNFYQKISLSLWYNWKNIGINPDDREQNFGVVKNDLEPKAAYKAASVLFKTLSGYRMEGRIFTEDPDDFILKVRNDKKTALAYWTVNEQHSLSITMESGRGINVDMFGTKTKYTWSQNILTLNLLQSPQYLLIDVAL